MSLLANIALSVSVATATPSKQPDRPVIPRVQLEHAIRAPRYTVAKLLGTI
jgi:hypothetical protein